MYYSIKKQHIQEFECVLGNTIDTEIMECDYVPTEKNP